MASDGTRSGPTVTPDGDAASVRRTMARRSCAPGGRVVAPSRCVRLLPLVLLLACGNPSTQPGVTADGGAPPEAELSCVAPRDLHGGRVIHVSPEAAPGGDGSSAMPYSSVLEAWRAANPGDVIELADGEYGAEASWTRLTGESASLGSGISSEVWPFKRDVTLRAAHRFGARFLGSVRATPTAATSEDVSGADPSGLVRFTVDAATPFDSHWVYEQTAELGRDVGPCLPAVIGAPVGPRRSWAVRVDGWYRAYEAARGRSGEPPRFDLTGATITHPLFDELVPPGVDRASFWQGAWVALYGWNNNVGVRRIAAISADGQTATLEGGALQDCSAADIAAGLCIRSLVPVGHPAFVTEPGTFGVQGDRLVYRPYAMDNAIRLPRHTWGYVANGSHGVRLEGLWFSEYGSGIAAPALGMAGPLPEDLVVTDCRVSDVRGIGVSLAGTRPILTRSLIEYTGNRGVSVTASGATVTCNFIHDWASKTGMFGSGAVGLTVAFNSLFTLEAQHGNGMAFYDGCASVLIAHNLVITPNNLALALADSGEGMVIEDNVFRGGVDWRGSVRSGARYQHNIGGITFYDRDTSSAEWWTQVFGRVVRDNVLYSLNPQLATNVPDPIVPPAPLPTTPQPSGNDGYFAAWLAEDGRPLQHSNLLVRAPGAANFDAEATRTFCWSERQFDPGGTLQSSLFARIYPASERYDFTLARGEIEGSDACGPTRIDPSTFAGDGGAVGIRSSIWRRFPAMPPDSPAFVSGAPSGWYLWNEDFTAP